MRIYRQYTLLLAITMLIAGIFLTSCSEDDAVNGGKPMISYVRVTNPAAADSLLESAYLGNLIAIVGKNLAGVKELWFNDQAATLIPTYITNRSILVNVPNTAPVEVTNQMKLVFGNGSELFHDFSVNIPAPEVVSMSNEYEKAGQIAVINGNYFFEPMRVFFGGDVEAEVVSVNSAKSMEIVVPEGAEPGPITVRSNFGSTNSRFHYLDQRNIILNYDDLTAEGSWRPGVVESVGGIDGNYLKLGEEGKTLNANDRIEDPYTSQFWGHIRYPEPRNLFNGQPDDYVLKFEANVVEWYGSYLNICWGPWDNAGNAEVWGNLNGRGIWGPWEEDETKFTTDGKWITVTIPLTEMKYRHGQENGKNVWIPDMPFDKNIAGTLSFWVIATPKAEKSPAEIYIDNVRIVEK